MSSTKDDIKAKEAKDKGRMPPTKPKLNLKFKPKEQVEFDAEGLPKATKVNLSRMSLEELETACKKGWVIDRHINPLLMELRLTIPTKATKNDKCQLLVEYKKTNGSRISLRTSSTDEAFKDTYETFNWRAETEVRFRGQTWILPHSTGFKRDLTTRFSEYRMIPNERNILEEEPGKPFKYQMLVVRYLEPKTPFRAVLGFHGLGSGKSRTGILTAGRFIQDGKRVLILLPGSLRANWLEQLYRWGPDSIRIEGYAQLKPDERKEQERAANRVIAHYIDILTYNERGLYSKLMGLVNPETAYLEDRLIIIDETHDFVSRMSKPGNLSRKVYHFFMDNLRNCKILGLSGTPLLNTPYELGIWFNISRGKMRQDNVAFPETEESFNDLFVNYVDRSITNAHLFKRRISGLVSYYAGTTDLSAMPEEIEMPVEEIPMSEHQFNLYISERYLESKKESGGATTTKNSSSGSSSANRKSMELGASGSAFRTYSRMVSNFCFPPEISRPKPVSARDFRSYEKFKNRDIKTKDLVEDVKDEINLDEKEDGFLPTEAEEQDNLDEIPEEGKVLTKKQRQLTYLKMLDEAYNYLMDDANRKRIFSDKGLDQYSRKMSRVWQNMQKGPGHQGLIYVYTEFRILEGVRLFGAVLEYHGYQRADFTKIKTMDDMLAAGPALRYGIISSDEDAPQRKILLEIFRHPANSHGEYIKVILGTSASSQGINLLRVTQVHVMEEYWNKIRKRQVQGRAARFESHVDLPKEEQKVYIYSYRMILDDAQKKEIINKLDNVKEAVSTEEYIHALASVKDEINSQFLKMIKEASIDCNLNYLVNIKLDKDLTCMDVPEDSAKYMYMPNIAEDPLDNEYTKRIKYESYLPAKKTIEGTDYGFKVYANGKPYLTEIDYKGKKYTQTIILYDYEMLKNNIEVKRKYYILGLNNLIDPKDLL